MASIKNAKVSKFWGKFQNYIGTSIPDILVKILDFTGFDNALSLSALDESDIKIIENLASIKLKDLINKCPLYSGDEPFEYSPGHKKTILNLCIKAQEFLSDKKQKNNSEEIELLTGDEIEKLKGNLLKKLNHAHNLKDKFEEKSILGAIDPYISKNSKKSRTKASYKCTIQCHLCPKQIPVTFNGHWEASNIDRHVKIHLKKIQSLHYHLRLKIHYI